MYFPSELAHYVGAGWRKSDRGDMVRGTEPSEAASSKRVVHIALFMIAAAVALTMAAMLARAFQGAAPDGTWATLNRTVASQALMAATAAFVIAFAVWLPVHARLFRRRTSLQKSLLVLLCMVLIATAAGVLTRLRVVAVYQNSYRTAVYAWQDDTAGRIRRLNHQLNTRLHALDVQNTPWSEINAENVEQAISRRQQSIGLLDAHLRQLDREMAGAVGRAPDVPAQWRMLAIDNIEAHLELGRTTFALERQFFEAEEQLLTLLSDHKGEWVNSGGSFSFENPAVAQRFDDLTARRNNLEERGLQAARAWSDFEAPARRAGSARPPPR